jgi:hypothetical protein
MILAILNVFVLFHVSSSLLRLLGSRVTSLHLATDYHLVGFTLATHMGNSNPFKFFPRAEV